MWKTAYRFLTYDTSNLLGILAGIVVSVVLVGLELSMFNNMMQDVRGLTRNYPTAIWVVNPKTQSALQLQNIDVRVGRELQSIPGVERVHPIVFASGSAKSPKGTKLTVQILGIEAPTFVGGPRQYTPGTNVSDLVNEGAVIFNKTEVGKFDNIKPGDYLTINDERVYLSGLSIGMTAFGSSYAITTLERARALSGLSTNYVSAYLVQIDSTQATKAALINRINTEIGQVRAVEGQVLGSETIRYMMTTSNTVASFLMMVVFSAIGGFAIVGVTLYSSVNDRIRDYGTVKAIGGSNGLLRRLILLQGLLYALIGFSISFALLQLMAITSRGGEMEMTFPGWLIASLVGVTSFISVVSSLIAMRKITKLEPVQIFRM
ncbi:ABC transporter permease [Larkinella sp. GY13]|uniref:ABC transporter permease n=1 Tax=Larkinella sp. GY13 TaxID=3453720 RepID=UPI003EEACA26